MIDNPTTILYNTSMNKGFTMTIIFCSMFLNACTTLEPLNAIPWLDDMSQEELTEAREHIGLKHHEHYEEKRILDAHND
jgi:hypothetical protein